MRYTLITDLSLCGQHASFLETRDCLYGCMPHLKTHDGPCKPIKFCKKCQDLLGKHKRCLRCEKYFQPGCKYKFICLYCQTGTRRKKNDGRVLLLKQLGIDEPTAPPLGESDVCREDEEICDSSA